MKIDQCLFGYDDGHRLLASSLPLGSETSFLTELSDLAPGTIFDSSEGYWTGVPVPTIGRYVLMRTWPAPEMSRPGCVWTHALLVEPKLLESVEDLSILQTLVTRPGGNVDREGYREPMSLDATRSTMSTLSVDSVIVRRLILSLYATGGRTVEIASPGQLDEPLFAVWSQQWPRLRRNFRFQTATSRSPRTTGSTRFDITAVLEQKNEGKPCIDEPDTPWLTVAALDVQEGISGSLRKFLRCYGRDVRRQRGSFRPLVEVKAIDNAAVPDSGPRLIEIVTKSFPGLDDAHGLKQDLIDGTLVAPAQAQLLRFVLSSDGEAVFPPPTSLGIAKLANFWPEKPEELLQLAEASMSADDSLGRSVFEIVTGGVQESALWLFTRSSPGVRKRMVQAHPQLLLNDAALALDDAAFVELLPLISSDMAGIKTLISRLLRRNNENLAKVAFEHFPGTAAGQMVLAASGGASVGDAWFNELAHRPKVLLLQPEVMDSVSRMSQLYEFAEKLGWLTSEVTAAGTTPWIGALARASNDLPEEKEDTFFCFLIALALTSGGDGGLYVLERFFDGMHGKMLKSRLSLRAQQTLLPLLPDLGWIRGWDLALRFRMAVAATYVRYQWPPKSYATLVDNRKIRAMLADAASDVTGGERYAKAAAF